MTPTLKRTAIAAAAAALAAGGASAGYVARGEGAQPETVRAATPVASTGNAVTAVYRAAKSGVVEITSSSGSSAFPDGRDGSSRAVGSGFVYDSSGRIVTNAHLVDNAQSVSVRFANGRSATATVVGADTSSDLAVLKVDSLPDGVTPLVLGSARSLQVGDGVVAIGSPFGLEGSVTSGIVSALEREISAPDGYPISGVVQTDAAINHGNSGGPLLDLGGKVVGVNAQIESDSGGNDGVGFAIPADTVRSVVAQIVAGKTVAHAFLGVSVEDVADGARIADVRSGTPAERAGLRAGDVVTAAGGTAVHSASGLRAAIDGAQAGDRLALTVIRAGDTKTVEVTLGTRPD